LNDQIKAKGELNQVLSKSIEELSKLTTEKDHINKELVKRNFELVEIQTNIKLAYERLYATTQRDVIGTNISLFLSLYI